jgi:hypothetical protein
MLTAELGQTRTPPNVRHLRRCPQRHGRPAFQLLNGGHRWAHDFQRTQTAITDGGTGHYGQVFNLEGLLVYLPRPTGFGLRILTHHSPSVALSCSSSVSLARHELQWSNQISQSITPIDLSFMISNFRPFPLSLTPATRLQCYGTARWHVRGITVSI